MAFVYLAFSIAFITCFALCYKVAARWQCELRAVNLWMSVSGTAITVVQFAIVGGAYNSTAAIMGLVTGLITYLATLSFFYHMKTANLAVSWTVIGLAIVFPVAASVLIWHEHPTTKQWAGLCLMLLALVLFGLGKKPEKKAEEV